MKYVGGNWVPADDNGGGAGSATNLQLDGTAGQAVTGDGSSASFHVSGGFWPGTAWGPVTCCVPPMRGNVDNDTLDVIDISDLVYLVDYMFTGGPAPECWEEANVDGSAPATPPDDGPDDVDISDLVYLVDYMFTGGPAPLGCP